MAARRPPFGRLPLVIGPFSEFPGASGPSSGPESGANSPSDARIDPVCSARGCRSAAVWALRWNNPKLHTPDRWKIWTACDDHRESLESFLRSRGFLKDTVGLADLE